MGDALERLRTSLANAPVIWKGDYPYFIHPITDGVPRLDPEVLKAVRLLVGDIVNKERYVMLPAEPGEGDPVLGKFRTVSDAKRFANRSDITEFSLWTRLKVVGGGASLNENFSDKDEDEDIDDDLGDLLDDDSDLPDLEEDADLDELL